MANRPRAKGTRGEGEAKAFWQAWFPRADRAPLRGTLDTGDLLNVPMIVSVKRCETWPIHKWRKDLVKMRKNAGGSPGVIQARRNRDEWVFILDEESMTFMLNALYGEPDVEP